VRFDAAPAEECAPAGDPEVIDPGAGEGEGEAPPATPGDDECFGVGFEEGFVACDDADSDHVSDEDEAVEGTDPALADTDGDGLDDGEELAVFFTDPFATDTDGGGKTDGEEVAAGLDPRDPSDDVAAEPGEEENLCQDVEGNFVLCSFP
jgi:hypothetical protein